MIFDEKYYLKTYPDVAKAVQDGQFKDALQHFTMFGCLEGRLTCKITGLSNAIFEAPSVVLYTTTKNEEFILPFFLMHYAPFVKKMIFYDNQSTDKTREIISAFPNTEIRDFYTNEITDDNILINIKNHCYQEQRGKADFVIICDTDEFLYAPNLIEVLILSKRHGVTVINTRGYEMVSEKLPVHGVRITDQIRHGVEKIDFAKNVIFNPNITIDYAPGAHWCFPTGNVVTGDIKLMLLHYKHISLDFILKKTARTKLSDDNIANGWGVDISPEYVMGVFNGLLRDRRLVI